MQNRLKKRKHALDELKRIYQNPSKVLIIHYSCESFYDIKDGRTPRVTSIAVRFAETRQTKSFSIHKVAEVQNIQIDQIDQSYDKLERQMLEEFFKFAKEHSTHYWIHWNMRDINYGFQAIEHRYAVLKGKPYVIPDDKKYDMGSKIIDIYSNSVAGHPRFTSLVECNKMTHKDMLSGADEASAFDQKEFVKLHRSTLRKVDIMQSILEKIVEGNLKTHAKWQQIYGITPQGFHELVKDNWIASLIYSIVMMIIGGLITKALNLS